MIASGLAAPVARIALRYLGAALVTLGVALGMTPELAEELSDSITRDPDTIAALETALGVGLGFLAEAAGAAILVATEAWFALAKRFGWAT